MLCCVLASSPSFELAVCKGVEVVEPAVAGVEEGCGLTLRLSWCGLALEPKRGMHAATIPSLATGAQPETRGTGRAASLAS